MLVLTCRCHSPQMKKWPGEHGFAAWVMELQQAMLLDMYGGAAFISAEDYYAAKPWL